jgi:hypothetical protein
VKVEFELWQLITLCVTLLGLFIGMGKLLLARFERYIETRFDILAEESSGWREVERDVRTVEIDVLKLRVELAERYVNRDDYVRGQTVIEAKLDAISSELKNVQIQGARREN